MTDVQQAVPVAQEDREAAAKFAQAVVELDNPTEFGALAAQAFARHRLASLPCKSGEGAGAIAPKPAEVGGLLDMIKADVEREGGYWSMMVRAGLLLDILNELYAHRARANAAIDATQTREAELVAALEFYADRDSDGYRVDVTNYGLSTEEGEIVRDGGARARAAVNARGGA